MHLLFIVLALVACGSATTATTTPAPAAPAAPAAEPAYAPQLFTVDELRAGCPAGRTIEFRVEVDGKPTTIERLEFTAVDARQATIHSITRDEAGNVLADKTGTSAWQDLHKHGQFPADATTFEDNVGVTVPAGTFTARVYTVKAGDKTSRYWFATTLPGPPVQFETEQAGKVIMRAQTLRAR